MRKKRFIILGGLAGICILAVLLYQLPPIHDRLSWRLDNLRAQVKYAFNPPEAVVFKPQDPVAEVVRATMQAMTPSPTPTLPTDATAVDGTAAPTLTITPVPTPLPDRVALTGIRYQDQHGLWNYCAPANLAMALSYWGWEGDRMTTGAVLKPFAKDKNVMPYEMADYVTSQTQLKVALRYAGTPELVKSFLAAGYPVLVEKGAFMRDTTNKISWMGHYQVITGYDEAKSIFIAQDSYYTKDYPVPYDEFISGWRAFNNVYLIIYPAEKEQDVMNLLGADADEAANNQHAADHASDEIYATSGLDQFFAWFDRGSSLVQLQDYSGAAQAYDQAFAIYATIAEDQRPWRIMWYETGPYYAYYFVGRYYDVLNLADTTINTANEPYLEESFTWRARAKIALGDRSGAIEDLQKALEYHPGFAPAVSELQALNAGG